MTLEKPRTWTSFSLRTLFILTTLCCIVFGAWAAYVNPFRLEARSLDAVKRLQGEFELRAATGPGWQRWLVTTFLGRDAFVHVSKVNLANRNVDDAALRTLAGLAHVEDLSLDYTKISDAGIDAVRGMHKLRRLSLRYTNVGDGAAAHIAGLPQLETVYLTGTRLTDNAVDLLTRQPAMDELYIRWTRITDSGAQRLSAALPHCAIHHHALSTDP